MHEHDEHEGWEHGRRRRPGRRGEPGTFEAWIGGPPPPPPPFPPFPGMGYRFMGGGRRRGRGRARRGDIRAAILLVLADRPMHGYEVMNELTERSGGVWRPSPGSVYPTLQQLEDEGLVTLSQVEGKRAFRLTDAGNAEAAQVRTRGAPWDVLREGISDAQTGLHTAVTQLVAAIHQVGQAGNDAQVAGAQALLDDTRRQIYRLLADDAPPEEGTKE
jgi:DNA-binding PadR family transcriptional regulator